jgi:hypothetical protein
MADYDALQPEAENYGPEVAPDVQEVIEQYRSRLGDHLKGCQAALGGTLLPASPASPCPLSTDLYSTGTPVKNAAKQS